jgi:hypothetical protein
VTASSVHDPETPGGDVGIASLYTCATVHGIRFISVTMKLLAGSKATLGDLRGLEEYFKREYYDMCDGGR